jgi:hypothetical protein
VQAAGVLACQLMLFVFTSRSARLVRGVVNCYRYCHCCCRCHGCLMWLACPQGAVTDMREEKVVQPLLVTSSALALATECVRMILKVCRRDMGSTWDILQTKASFICRSPGRNGCHDDLLPVRATTMLQCSHVA